MRGCLFTLALAAVVLATLVFAGLPAVAAGVLTAGVEAAGLEASDTTVTVTADPPWDLLGLHADRVRVRATRATYRGIRIGALDVTLLDVSLLGRVADGVAGRLAGVTVPDAPGGPLSLGDVTLAGGGGRVTATASIAPADARALVAAEVASRTGVGVPAAAVRLLAPNRVVIAGRAPAAATLAVSEAGDLVVSAPRLGQVTLLRAGGDLPLRLSSVAVDAAGGLSLAGVLALGPIGADRRPIPFAVAASAGA